MFSLLKKMFGSKPAKVTPVPASAPVRPVRTMDSSASASASSAQPKPQVAIAQLCLAAIVNKFPEDLRKYVLRMPDDSVTVALPHSTIHKQLATGNVKMSLASLFRQAPAGTFREWKSEEKRMVEVPLSEVMKHVEVQTLRRRTDQRQVDLPKGAPQLFGDRKNKFAVKPVFDEEDAPAPAPAEEEPVAESDEEEFAEPTFRMTPRADGPLAPPAELAPEAELPKPAKAAPTAPPAKISMRLADICEAWPEPIRSEAIALNGAQLSLPGESVAAGLAKGKVAFTWGDLRRWLTPAPAEASAAPEGTELSLPLKIVAPLFMAQSKPAARKRRTVEMDDSLPALFGGGRTAPAAPEPVVAPAPAPAPASMPLAFKLAAPEPELESAPAPVPAVEVEIASPVQQIVFAPAAPAAHTLGELFGKPEQTQWSAKEIIERTAHLPGVNGAALALHEGLLVAAALPPEMKGDTIAAFLPQIFARLNIYTGEMQLADVEKILMTSGGAQFQAYRLGQVYLAVLGRPGEALPWEALGLVVRELAAQAPR